jgi:hypothetical protein
MFLDPEDATSEAIKVILREVELKKLVVLADPLISAEEVPFIKLEPFTVIIVVPTPSFTLLGEREEIVGGVGQKGELFVFIEVTLPYAVPFILEAIALT